MRVANGHRGLVRVKGREVVAGVQDERRGRWTTGMPGDATHGVALRWGDVAESLVGEMIEVLATGERLQVLQVRAGVQRGVVLAFCSVVV